MFAVRMLLKSLVIMGLSGPVMAMASVGKIEKVGAGNTVKVMRAGSTVQLKENDRLEANDEISTDGNTAVDIRLEDDTLIRVGVNSSYTAQEDSKIHSLVHRLLTGVVRVLVKPTDADHKGNIKFRMNTAEGTIGVRGTEFVVIRNNGETQLKGLDGEVLFGPLGADFANVAQFVVVHRGFESHIKAGAKLAEKAEKFDLRKYLAELNSSGPLSKKATVAANRYTRNNPAPSAPAAVPGSLPSSASQAQSLVMPTTPPKEKPDLAAKAEFQRMLFVAAQDGDEAAAKIALANGANINGKSENSFGHTALQIAMLNGKKNMFIFLIHNGADVNVEDEDGHTPLMFVALHHLDMDFVKALVNPGAAEIHGFTDKEPKTALDLARKHDYKEMADYLGSKQADEDLKAAKEEQKQLKKRSEKSQSAEGANAMQKRAKPSKDSKADDKE